MKNQIKELKIIIQELKDQNNNNKLDNQIKKLEEQVKELEYQANHQSLLNNIIVTSAWLTPCLLLLRFFYDWYWQNKTKSNLDEMVSEIKRNLNH